MGSRQLGLAMLLCGFGGLRHSLASEFDFADGVLVFADRFDTHRLGVGACSSRGRTLQGSLVILYQSKRGKVYVNAGSGGFSRNGSLRDSFSFLEAIQEDVRTHLVVIAEGIGWIDLHIIARGGQRFFLVAK